MTVAELLARLSDLPPDLPVYYDTGLDDEPAYPVSGAIVNVSPKDWTDTAEEPLSGPVVFLYV